MKSSNFVRAAGFAAILAVMCLAGRASSAQILPTGATITPNAAPGSVFVPLTTSLPDFPVYTPDGAETTAISPDGKTMLVLTSGYNLMVGGSGDYSGTDSGEFVFVFDISTPSTPVQTQVVFLSDYDTTFDGIIWAPNGSAFYVGGGADDNIHAFTLQGGLWAESGTPINLGHNCDLMCEETETGPTAAIIGITPDGNTLFVANPKRTRSHRFRSSEAAPQLSASVPSGVKAFDLLSNTRIQIDPLPATLLLSSHFSRNRHHRPAPKSVRRSLDIAQCGAAPVSRAGRFVPLKSFVRSLKTEKNLHEWQAPGMSG